MLSCKQIAIYIALQWHVHTVLYNIKFHVPTDHRQCPLSSFVYAVIQPVFGQDCNLHMWACSRSRRYQGQLR